MRFHAAVSASPGSELCADAIAGEFAEISGVSLPLTAGHGSTTRSRSHPRTVDVGAGTALS